MDKNNTKISDKEIKNILQNLIEIKYNNEEMKHFNTNLITFEKNSFSLQECTSLDYKEFN